MADVEKIAAELRALVDPMAEAMPDGVRLTGLIQVGRALLDELSRLRKALIDVRIELIHGEDDTYERITTCKEIVERALSEREGQDG